MPLGDDPSGHGFGVERRATGQPDLPAPEDAWVCQFVLVDQHDSGEVSAGVWVRHDGPDRVPSEDLADLRAALGDLTPADPDQACTADLGPRWLVSYTQGGDLTGVVVDNFGCSSVRLTDNPHVTPPGADGQEGVVGGVLDGGIAVLAALGLIPDLGR